MHRGVSRSVRKCKCFLQCTESCTSVCIFFIPSVYCTRCKKEDASPDGTKTVGRTPQVHVKRCGDAHLAPHRFALFLFTSHHVSLAPGMPHRFTKMQKGVHCMWRRCNSFNSFSPPTTATPPLHIRRKRAKRSLHLLHSRSGFHYFRCIASPDGT